MGDGAGEEVGVADGVGEGVGVGDEVGEVVGVGVGEVDEPYCALTIVVPVTSRLAVCAALGAVR